MERKDSITIINRNYPPGNGITGESANHLAKHLIQYHNIEVNIVHVDGKYPGGNNTKIAHGKISKVNSIYNGKHKILRLIGSFIESYRLIRKAKSLESDFNIVMTDPPFLNFWSAKIFKQNQHWIAWNMDLFPEAFAASNLSKKTNVFYKYIDKTLRKNKPIANISLGILQQEFVNKKYALTDSTKSFIIPCGITTVKEEKEKPQWYNDDSKIYFGYCGNLGEAHSVEFVSTLIQQLDPEKHKFILSVYGTKSRQLLDKVSNHKVVTIVDFVYKKDLPFIDIHLVSLTPNWNHVCVPSKAVSAVCSGSTFLYSGSKDCDNWNMLNKAGWFIDLENNLKNQINNFLQNLTDSEIKEKKNHAIEISSKLNNELIIAYDKLAKFIKSKNNYA